MAVSDMGGKTVLEEWAGKADGSGLRGPGSTSGVVEQVGTADGSGMTMVSVTQ